MSLQEEHHPLPAIVNRSFLLAAAILCSSQLSRIIGIQLNYSLYIPAAVFVSGIFVGTIFREPRGSALLQFEGGISLTVLAISLSIARPLATYPDLWSGFGTAYLVIGTLLIVAASLWQRKKASRQKNIAWERGAMICSVAGSASLVARLRGPLSWGATLLEAMGADGLSSRPVRFELGDGVAVGVAVFAVDNGVAGGRTLAVAAAMSRASLTLACQRSCTSMASSGSQIV